MGFGARRESPLGPRRGCLRLRLGCPRAPSASPPTPSFGPEPQRKGLRNTANRDSAPSPALTMGTTEARDLHTELESQLSAPSSLPTFSAPNPSGPPGGGGARQAPGSWRGKSWERPGAHQSGCIRAPPCHPLHWGTLGSLFWQIGTSATIWGGWGGWLPVSPLHCCVDASVYWLGILFFSPS